MRIISSKDYKVFDDAIAAITGRAGADNRAVEAVVSSILGDIKERADAALFDYTLKFDGVDVSDNVEVTGKEIDSALKRIPKNDRRILELAARRIEDFHQKQAVNSWSSTDAYGNTLGVKVTPLERVGIYVPGGKAAYPSTVLMNAIPARVAGVDEIVMVSPPAKSGMNDYVLAAARLAGVDRVFRIGGAQAVGALAYGTESVPKVDKITGPGNVYVATAKRLVFGAVDIDMIAGPSEILIINDSTGEPAWMAIDLLSQAEHDELASSILITTSETMARAVEKEAARLLKTLKRRAIAEASLEKFGVIITVDSLEEAAQISNSVAPEHLELYVKRPFELLRLIRNAGAIFLGGNTPEAAGDYLAGPNHTLPTGGTARFSSPLGVEDFIKRTSIIGFTEKGIAALGPDISRFADIEGLDAHGKSAGARLKKKTGRAHTLQKRTVQREKIKGKKKDG